MERDPFGRFVKSPGPGRPPKEREKRYLEITLSTCTFEDWGAIVAKATEQAKRGDATARKWLSDYLLGTPVQHIGISGPDGGPVEIDDYREQLQRRISSIAERVGPSADSGEPKPE